MIPKKIYQTWFTKKVDQNIQDIIDNMLRLNSSYEYELYDDDDIFYFIKENYEKDIVSAYESLQIGAAKADLWRYLILYKNGGVYLDMDSSIYSNLDNLIKNNDKAVISRENNKDIFVQWCLIFDKNHPVLEKTIKKCIFNIKNKISNNVIFVTGPITYSESIKETYEPYNLNIYDTNDEIINKQINDKVPEYLKCTIYSNDYKGYCNFKHNKSNFLYINKPDWRSESLNKNLFKI